MVDLWGVSLADVGPTTLLVIVVLLVLTGRLVPKSALDYERENSRAWQTSSQTKDETISELKGAVTELLPLARSTDHAIRSLQWVGQQHGVAVEQGEESPK